MKQQEMKEAIVAILPKCSSILSLCGSIWIVIEITTTLKKRSNVYHRLLFMMSIYDILESIWNFASSWPIPQDTSNIFDPRGTTSTCIAQGFFLQLGLTIPIYNAGLSIYYLLLINWNMTDERIQKYAEPWLHGIPFIIGWGTSIASLKLDLFNNANLWCWIAPYPLDCIPTSDLPTTTQDGIEITTTTCERGDNAWIYRWIFYFGPLWTCILVAMVTMIIVYIHVVDTETAKQLEYTTTTTTTNNKLTNTSSVSGIEGDDEDHNENKNNSNVVENESESGGGDGDGGGGSSSLNFKQVRHSLKEGFDLEEELDDVEEDEIMLRTLPGIFGGKPPLNNTTKTTTTNNKAERRISNRNSLWFSSWKETEEEGEDNFGNGKDAAASSAALAAATAIAELDQEENDNDNNGNGQKHGQHHHHGGKKSGGSSSSHRRRRRHPSSYYLNPKTRRSQQVLGQGLFYLSAFYMTHLFSTTNRILQLVRGQTYFTLLVFHSFFDPLQGFLNFLVYRRPVYVRHRKIDPTLSFFGAWRKALRFHFQDEADLERRQINDDNNYNDGTTTSQDGKQSPTTDASEVVESSTVIIATGEGNHQDDEGEEVKEEMGYDNSSSGHLSVASRSQQSISSFQGHLVDSQGGNHQNEAAEDAREEGRRYITPLKS